MTGGTCYVVKMGRKPGIYNTWAEVKEQTDGFMGASFKKCDNRKEAKKILGIKNEKDLKKLEVEQTKFLSKGLNILNIYVDGSFDQREGIYAYAFIVVESEKVTYKENGAEINRKVANALDSAAGELKAAMKALKYASLLDKRHIVIYHDNLQIKDLLDGTNEPKNEYQRMYIRYMNSLIDRFKLKLNFTKVKAHNGNQFNELVDKLAKEALRKKRTGISRYKDETIKNENNKIIWEPKGKMKEQLYSWGFNVLAEKYEKCEQNYIVVKQEIPIMAKSLLNKSRKSKVNITVEQAIGFYNLNIEQMYKSFKKMKKRERKRKRVSH